MLLTIYSLFDSLRTILYHFNYFLFTTDYSIPNVINSSSSISLDASSTDFKFYLKYILSFFYPLITYLTRSFSMALFFLTSPFNLSILVFVYSVYFFKLFNNSFYLVNSSFSLSEASLCNSLNDLIYILNSILSVSLS